MTRNVLQSEEKYEPRFFFPFGYKVWHWNVLRHSNIHETVGEICINFQQTDNYLRESDFITHRTFYL
jgi:hypothetical protein